MKKASIGILILVLTATLFAGCRNTGNNPGNTTVPTSSTAKPTMGTQLPLPTYSGDDTTPGDPSSSGIEGRHLRPSARGRRYK